MPRLYLRVPPGVTSFRCAPTRRGARAFAWRRRAGRPTLVVPSLEAPVTAPATAPLPDVLPMLSRGRHRTPR